jgi:hypothetical protein
VSVPSARAQWVKVRLPGFVGLVGFAAVQGRFGASLRFGGDEAGTGGRRRPQSVAFDVPSERAGAGVQAVGGQFTAQGAAKVCLAS